MPKPKLSPYKLHVATWNNCTACDLCNSRKKVVHYRGRIPCDVLFVGDSPGDSEDVLGRPFSGPAGRLLDYIVEEAITLCGLSLSTGYMYSVACISKVNGNKVGEPRPDQLKTCLPKFTSLINIAQSFGTIVTLGNLSAKQLEEARKIIPNHVSKTFKITHPAVILRADISQKGLMVQKAIIELSDHLTDVFIPF